MATNSSTSLYTFTSNVQVSSNNFTTLYNTTGGNVTTANVPAKNFTTLYTEQDILKPTLPYGNSNVEAFLNVGYDAGGNQVQNIHMANSLYVGGNSYLGPVGNVFITGGTLNYVLTTDGTGNLSWSSPLGQESTPYIHFDVVTTANNQSFTNAELQNYPTSVDFNVMKNGVNIEPTLYTKTNATTVQINILLNAGDSIDILASGAGGSGPGGNIYEVQYNGGAYLSGNSQFTYDQANSLLTVNNLQVDTIANIAAMTVLGHADFDSIANVHIPGGSANYVIKTDGAGNLSWGSPSTTTAAGSNTQVQFNSSGSFSASAAFTFNSTSNVLTVTHIAGEGGNIANITAANVFGTVANATYAANAGNAATATSATSAGYAVTAGSTTFAENANIANIANAVAGSNVSGNVVGATTAYGLDAGLANVHIYGGTNGYALTTDGTGNLSWVNIATGVPNYANYAGTIVNSAQPNITSTGTLTDLTVSGNVILQRAFEKVTPNSTGSTGTVNFDVITQSVLLKTANATANFTLNIRGNSTVTLDTLLPTNDSLTIAYVNPVGATAYYANVIQIDGSTITPSYVGGVTPAATTRLTSATQSYTYTIIKTAANTYTVLGSFTEYK